MEHLVLCIEHHLGLCVLTLITSSEGLKKSQSNIKDLKHQRITLELQGILEVVNLTVLFKVFLSTGCKYRVSSSAELDDPS